jgi:catechol-2,3-dioxygenase
MPAASLRFSHVGLHVIDMARMEDFYARVLGFTVTDRGQLQRPGGSVDLVFLSRDPDEHHQIVLASGRPEASGFNPINQLSFKTDTLSDLKALHSSLVAEGLREITPITHGNALSVYARDPEGNRLELYFDLPWYVTQPVAVPVDLTLPETEIMGRAQAHARLMPGFRSRAQWREDMAQRMGRV